MASKDLLDLAALEDRKTEIARKLDQFNRDELEPLLKKQAKLKQCLLDCKKEVETALDRVILARKQTHTNSSVILERFTIGAKLPAQIIACLTSNPKLSFTKNDLLKAGVTASSPSVLSAALSRLAAIGKIERSERGRYRMKH